MKIKKNKEITIMTDDLRDRIIQAEEIGYLKGKKEMESSGLDFIACLCNRYKDKEFWIEKIELIELPRKYTIEKHRNMDKIGFKMFIEK